MNLDKAEFYYRTKHASSISAREKEDQIAAQEEKVAANIRQMVSSFATSHPKAVESAITGGVLGAGSELVMPANKDQFGQPSTNLGEIGKRALLGATLGGIGGEVKTQVRQHVLPKLAVSDIEKVAGKFDKLKQFASNNAGSLIGASTLGGANAILGYNQEVPDRKGNFIQNSPKNKVLNAATGGLYGAVTGGLLGHAYDKVRTLKNSPKIKDELFWPKVNKSMGKNASALDLLKSIPNSIRNGVAARGVAVAGKLAPPSLLQTAGKYLAKSPTLGGAAVGAAGGAAGNFLSGEDHAAGSMLGGAALGALGGKSMMLGNAGHNPLFGKSFGTGVRNELKAGLKAKPGLATTGEGALTNARIRAGVGSSAGTQATEPISAPSLQNAPSLNHLVDRTPTVNPSTLGPNVTPKQSIGPAGIPQRPQSIDWSQKQRGF